jgi:aspartate aminotransferase-like enzyme
MEKDFTLFSVGPVEMSPEILKIGARKLPYFRTEEFSAANLSICSLLKEFVSTEDNSEVVILTASGSGAMEAAVINTFNNNDKILVVVGGSFGERFAKICEIHQFNKTVIKLKQGETLKKEHLESFRGKGYAGLLINAHETSTGVYHNLSMIGEFCKQEQLLFVVDAISSFLADPYYMDQWNIDVTILSTQKALALPPGLSILIINKKTAERIKNNNVSSLYFNLKDYFDNMRHGQTPYTPAVGIILQLKARLEEIKQIGADNIVKNTAVLANDFRQRIENLPFIIPSERLSNALTPLQPSSAVNAHQVFLYLKDNYNIFVCPNGGKLKESLFRVGHMGNIVVDDNKKLIEAFWEMKERDLI